MRIAMSIVFILIAILTPSLAQDPAVKILAAEVRNKGWIVYAARTE